MKAFLLDDLSQLRNHLASQGTLLTPQQTGGSTELHWLPLSKNTPNTNPLEKPVLPTASAKQFLFTEREHLFRFENQAFIETLPEIEPQILFGVRSCDLCAISYQDQFFQQDPYYQARRQKTLLVGIDCTLPCDGGFCPSMNAGPFIRTNQADIACHL